MKRIHKDTDSYKARKEYKCDKCGKTILKGQKYKRGTVYYGYGDKETLFFCSGCY